MPAVVFTDMSGLTEKVQDAELRAMLQDLNKEDGNRWELFEAHIIHRPLFRKPYEERRYALYWDCRGEWQIINSFSGFSLSREEMGNLLLGMRMERDSQRAKQNQGKKETP